MSGFLLDTDIISLAQFGHPKVIARMAAHSDSLIHLSVVSFQEQMRGWLGRFNKLNSAAKLADWFDRLVNRIFSVWKRYGLLPFPEPAILRFEHFRSLRLGVGLMDLRISVIALENGLTVVTHNLSD